MIFLGLHFADWLVLVLYFLAMIWIGRRTASGVHGQNDFFLAGRKLGRIYQFFLNFGNMTDATGAVRTSSVVYNQGVGGVWLLFQTLFMTPYYWFLMPWFRRARLTTMADLFVDRFGGRSLAVLYAVVGIVVNIVAMGGGYLVTYKVLEVFLTKPEASYSAVETAMVSDFREFSRLNDAYRDGRLAPGEKERYEYLKKREERGEIKSHISYVRPLPFYLLFAVVVGAYLILGGMTAAAITDAFQGIMIVVFSLILIPFGIGKLGGLESFHERLPERMLDLLGSGAASDIAWYSIAAILLVSFVQIHGVPGNMAIAGSARDETAAALGAVSGGFTKRLMIIAWCFCGLIAFALYGGGLSDPDAVWGALCRSLLMPGLFGLMLVGLLAAEMAGMSSQCLTLSALFVKNIYMVVWPHKTEAQGLVMGRILIALALLASVGVALLFDDLIAFAKMQLTLSVAFGAAVLVMFKWRRVTEKGMIIGVLLSLLVIVVVPFAVPSIPALRDLPALHVTTTEKRQTHLVRATAEDVAGGEAARVDDEVEKVQIIAPRPVFFDHLVSVDPTKAESGRQGQGRFHFELFLLSFCGVRVENLLPAQLLALIYVFDSILPFVLLFLVSLLTKERDPLRADRFYAKLRTRVIPDRDRDASALQEALANPSQSENQKLFPRTSWEFLKWRRSDFIAFFACCVIAVSILGLFAALLRMGRP